MSTEKYVMAKGYYGMGGSLAVAACAAYLAKRLNRKLIVDWYDGLYKYGDENVFNSLFSSPLSDVNPKELVDKKVLPEFWTEHVGETMPSSNIAPLSMVRVEDIEKLPQSTIDSADVIVVSRDGMHWHHSKYKQEMNCILGDFNLDSAIQAKVDRYLSNYFVSKTVIAIHYRHGNGEKTVVPPDPKWFFTKADELIDLAPEALLFVCTDCSAVLEAFQSRYCERVFSTSKNYPPLGSGGMHFNKSDDDRLSSAIEALTDMWLISESDYLIGSKSFFTGVGIKRSKRLTNKRLRVWVPEIRSYKPERGFKEVVAFNLLYKKLSEKLEHFDGLYAAMNHDKSGVLVYNGLRVCEFQHPRKVDPNRISKFLKDYRLYY